MNANKTALVNHHHTTGHNFNFDNFKILDKEQNMNKRLILEACYIWKRRDKTINFRTDTQNINSIYTSLINTITNK